MQVREKKADTTAKAVSIREKITVLSRVIKKERNKLWARKNYIPIKKKIVKKKKEKVDNGKTERTSKI